MTNANVCNICGANYVFKNGRWICPACGAYKPEELSNEEVTLLYNAQQQLRLADFDEADSLYRDIIEKYPDNHEGYWGLVLAKYGIKYEQDYNGKMIPTCYAASYESVLRDKNYLRALELCDGDERRYLEEQADKIERIRREWVEQASKEPTYDIFLSYKDTESGTGSERTKDSYEAKELYDELSRLGYRVFFSRESLKGKAGENYEPYIFNALNTAHVMIVYGSRPEYFEATWIKNEWSRFLKRINNGEKQKNALIVVYHDLNPKDLVSPLNRLQGIDRKRLDFSRVLEKYCEKVVSAAKTVIPKIDRVEIGTRTGRTAGKVAKLETVELKRRDNAKSEIKREAVERREIGQYTLPPLTAAEENQLSVANAYLASGNFDDAEKIFSAVLENNPQNGSAIVGLLLTAARSKTLEEFGSSGVRNFTSWDRFEKALAFSDAGTSEKLLSAFATEAYRALRAGETEKSRAIYSHIENYDSESISRLRRELCTYVLDLIVKDPGTAAFFIDAYLLYESDTDRYIDTLSGVVKRAVKEGKFEFAEKYQKEWLSYAEDEYAPNLAALKVHFKTRTEDGVLDAIENAGEFSALETVLKGLNAESAARLFNVVSNRVNSIVLSDHGNAEAALGWIRTFFKYDFAERTNTIRELLHAILSSSDARRAEIFDLLLMMSDADEETTYDMYRDFARNVRLAGDFVLADRYYGKAIDVRETEECWKGRLMCHLGVPTAAEYPKKIGLLSDWTLVETILSLLTPSDRILFLNKMLEYALAALSLPGNKPETIVSIADKFFSYFPQESNGDLTRHLAAFAEKLKELKQFDAAERMYATLLGFDNRNHVAYWGLLQAKLKCRDENELVKQLVPLPEVPEFNNALLAAGSNTEAMQRYIGVQNRQRAWLERVEKRKKALRKLRRISAIAGICAAVALVIVGAIVGIVTYRAKESVLKFTRDGEGVSVSAGKYYKSDEVLVIPSESGGYPVVSVKKGGFRGHSEIREVVLPDTLIAIGDEAFAGCTNLESVTFADRSSTVSFVVVPRLASATPGAGNAALSRLSVIGARAFQGCAKLTEITLPQGLTSIGDEAFSDTGLVSVTIPETVVSVGKKVFENCEQLTEIRVVNRDEIPAEWDENWGGNVEEKIVYSLRVLLDYSKTDDPSHVGAALAFVFFGENYNLPVPTRAGYVFNGWYRGDVQLTNESGVSLSVWGFEDGGMATPSFTANENTIFFNGNGETSGDTHSQKLHTDETGALNANGFVRDGYTFLGWSTEQNGMVEYLDEADFKMSAEPSLVLYAVWEANRNTLHFNANGGEGSMQDIKVKTDSTAILPACAYSIPGYDFCGWALEPTGTPIYEDEAELKMGTEPSLILYAVWEAIPNLLVFDANGGEGTMQTLRLQTDATSAIPACTYSMRGYDCCGWATEPNGEIVYHSGDSYTMGADPSYTLYAVWEMATYTVTYALNNGTVDENPTSYTIESALFTLNQPSRPGYVFIGWSGTDLSQPTKTVTIPSNSVGNRTYTANWEANLNTLHFNANGGEGTMSDLAMKTDATSDLPVCSLSRRGYAFVGWSTTEDGTATVSDQSSYQMGAESEYTLYAVWEILSFRIVCDSQSGTISEDELTAEYGSTPTLPVPVLDHYVFGGWYSAIGGGGTQYADSTGAFVAPFEDCEDLNLYAYWKCSVDLTYNYSNGSYGITGVSGNYSIGVSSVGPKTVYLPDYYNGYPVTSILQDSFKDRNALETIYISSNIENIDRSAFAGCTGLTSIIVSDNNDSYHSEGNCLIATASKTLLLGCQTSIIPSNGSVTVIGDGAFKGCFELTSIIIPDSVTTVGESAFSGCSGLTTISIGNGITTIGKYAFSDSYFKNVTLPSAAWLIYFAKTNLETVVITGGNTINQAALSGCSTLTSIVIPNGVTKIEGEAFKGCSGLNSITIPDSVTSIEFEAFSGCSGLTSVIIPNGVTSIGDAAFSGCSSLQSITIPFVGASAGITSSSNYQFPFGYLFGTSSYSEAYGVAQTHHAGGASSTTTTTYYIPSSLKSVTIMGGEILCGAFQNCSGLTSIIFPDNITSIGEYAFDNCSGLRSISIPSCVTSIGAYAFSGCAGLTAITIPDGIAFIEAGVFKNCAGLTAIAIPDSVVSIGFEAFKWCFGLSSVTIPEGITRIVDEAFAGCTGLTSIVWNAINCYGDVGSYPSGLFYGCSNLTNISIASNVKTIPHYAFAACPISSITIPESVVTIGYSAFNSCSNLTSIIIPDSVETISGYAFSGCTGLVSISIGGNVTIIGEAAFSNCIGLTAIVIPDSVQYLGIAFDNCSGLKSVYIGKGVTQLPGGLFAGCSSLESITIPYVGDIPNINKTKEVQSPFGFLFGTKSYEGGVATQQLDYNSVAERDETITFYIPSSLRFVTVMGGEVLYGSFMNCSMLTSVVLSEGVTGIGEEAFSNCTNLTSVVVPYSINNVAEGAFTNCSSLLYNAYDNALYLGNENNPFVALIKASSVSVSSVSISERTKIIAASAFCNCSDLTSLIIPEGVTNIGEGILSGCSSLVSITIPFVGNRKSATFADTYQYPFGYLFGTTEYSGGVATQQWTNTKLTNVFDAVLVYYVPSSLKSVTVTGGNILHHAFANCSGLTEISIPSNVTVIGSSAFSNCTNLLSVTVPESVKIIQSCAFYNCSELTIISIPNSVTSIENNAFSGCSKLTSIAIPNSVTSIGEGVLSGCSSLQTLVIPFVGGSRKTASNTDQYPFGYIFGTSSYSGGMSTRQYYYGSSTSSTTFTTYYIPSSLKSVTITGGNILYGAFYNCINLTSVIIPDSVTSIGEWAFYYCSGLTSVTIPDSITDIGEHAFYGCSELASIVIPNNVTSIGSYAFYGCSSLTSITIPDSVTEIGEYAFYICSGVTSLAIGNGVTSIGNLAFAGCSGLTSITIPDNVTSIANEAFRGCTGLTLITIPDSVTWIGAGVLRGCSSLQSITIPFVGGSRKTASDTYQYPFGYIFGTSSYTGGVATEQAHYGGNLTSNIYMTYYIPSSLRSVTVTGGSILYGAFYNCSMLTSIVLQDVTSIGSNAFNNCTGLTSIIIPDSVTTIGAGAFYGCSSLSAITLPFVGESKKSASDTYQYPLGYIFGENSYTGGVATSQSHYGSNFTSSIYTTYYIPSSLRSVTVTGGNILRGAFSGCSGLISVILPASATSIGGRAFEGCSSLVSITIPGNVLSIDNDAFADCTSLNSVILPEGLTNIAHAAFSNCSGLSEIIIPGSVTNIGSQAFRGCSGLTEITIPKSVTSIGSRPFEHCSALMTINVELGNPVYHSSGNCLIETNSKKLIAGCNSSVIPNDGSVTSIEEGAFYGYSDLTSIIIPDSVTSIGNEAFRGCTGLTSVTIGNSVASIGSYVFAGCSNLTSVTFANTDGWYRTNTQGASSGTSITVTNPSSNATNLNSIYCDNYWYR